MGLNLGGVGDSQVAIDVVAHNMASQALDQVEEDVQDLGPASQDAAKGQGSLSNAVAIGMAKFQAFMAVARGAIDLVKGIGSAAIGGAADFEQYQVQFEVMLGSAEAAKERMEDLAEFGKLTPFELPEVVRASKVLQTFGGDLLATGDNLTLVGDIASGTGYQFTDVAMWIGRMYDALKSGRPFGEAAMRLQEMGAMSGESRNQIELIAEATAKGEMSMEEAWAAVSSQFGRFSGMMDKQSKTLKGAWSNVLDTLNLGLAHLGERALPVLEAALPYVIAGLEALFDWVGDIADRAETWVRENQAVVDALGTLGRIIFDVLIWALQQLGAAVEDVFSLISWWVGTVVDVVRGFASTFVGTIRNVMDLAAQIPGPWQETAAEMRDVLQGMQDDIDHFGITTVTTVSDVGPSSAERLRASTPVVREAAEETLGVIPDAAGKAAAETALRFEGELRSGWGSVQSSLEDALDRIGATLKSQKARKAWDDWAEGVIEAMERPMTGPQRIAYLEGILNFTSDIGKRLKQGLDSADPLVRESTQELLGTVREELDALRGKAQTYGRNTARAYIDGIAEGIRKYSTLVSNAVNYYIDPKLRAQSPPGPESPLHEIDRWGYRTAETYMENMARGFRELVPDVTGALGGLAVGFARPASVPLAGRPASVTIVNQYGPGSVRSDADIEEISRRQAETFRLLGLAAPVGVPGA